jgi:hypothetical protein
LNLRGFRVPAPFQIKIASLGGLTVLASLLLYQSIVSNYLIQIQNIEVLQEIAYSVLALTLLGLFVSLVGVTKYLMRDSLFNSDSTSSLTAITLSLALNDKRSFRVFVLSGLAYAVLFGFLSGFFVYQPLGIFSAPNGFRVPSALAVICCGSLGQMPQFVFYLTQQFAILIVPVNLILIAVVSWLVGMNAGICTFAYTKRPEAASAKWLVGLGAIVGLFTACPSCAGFFMLAILGLSGAVGLALTLSSYQTLFILVGLPILLVTPILTSRRLPFDQACLSTRPKDNDKA